MTVKYLLGFQQSQLAVEAYGAAIPTEQETSETFQRYPERAYSNILLWIK